MKKLIILAVAIMAVMLTACSEEEQSTYTFKNDSSSDGNSLTVYLKEYNDSGENIHTNTLTGITEGTSETYTAYDDAVKVKVYLKVNSVYRWIQQVYYLEIGGHITITLTDTTLIGNEEP